jgi:glycosyltransferase involved in cell wall biosynthesis
MKVVLVNTWEKNGGAAVACNRLFNAYKKQGIACKYVVLGKTSDDKNVIQLPKNSLLYKIHSSTFYIEQFLLKIIKKKHSDFSLSIFGIKLSKIKEIQEADIIHLHWVHNSFVDIYDLQTLIEQGKKIIWTMHDMWTFTGGCHYSGSCQLFKNECNACPQLQNELFFDTANNQFNKKSKIDFNKIKFITPSQWLCDIAKTSKLLQNSSITAIPNTINVDDFQPLVSEVALRTLGIKLNSKEKILLFVSMNTKDKRKGFDELKEAIKLYCKNTSENTQLIIIGRIAEQTELDTIPNLKITKLGRISDMKKIAAAYALADAFLIPSNQDNLPNTIMESLTCGTAVVAFKIGGIPEMIQHQHTGYLAEAHNVEEFAKGIAWILEHSDSIRNNCRKFALENYQENTIVNKHLEYYLN